ncbi:AAA family ATPase [Salinibacter ruber]|uniref:AAA family ATPase n=1 Tax=Salinibacter ruber TaxID=146919 RepID=UPI003C6E8633
MHIQSIRVREFGTIGHLEVQLADGLNVISGPNEAGKSTLMKAVWFALTRRCTSKAQEIREVVPNSGGTPEVKVGVVVDGTTYELEKTFGGQSGSAHLRVDHPNGGIDDHLDHFKPALDRVPDRVLRHRGSGPLQGGAGLVLDGAERGSEGAVPRIAPLKNLLAGATLVGGEGIERVVVKVKQVVVRHGRGRSWRRKSRQVAQGGGCARAGLRLATVSNAAGPPPLWAMHSAPHR